MLSKEIGICVNRRLKVTFVTVNVKFHRQTDIKNCKDDRKNLIEVSEP